MSGGGRRTRFDSLQPQTRADLSPSLNEQPEEIADHVLALYSAKLLAYTKHDPEKLVIDLEKVTTEEDSDACRKEGAVFIHTSKAGVTVTTGPGATVEKR